MKKYRVFLFFLLLICSSCQKYYLSIYQEKIDRDSLASTYVGTPDPRQKNPPEGQELIIEWQIPRALLKEKPSIHLQMIYKDYSESKRIYPIFYKAGYVTYSILGEEFKKTKGLLAYKAEIQTEDGKTFLLWQHQLWVNVIRLEDEEKQEPLEDVEPPINEDDEEESATFFPPID